MLIWYESYEIICVEEVLQMIGSNWNIPMLTIVVNVPKKTTLWKAMRCWKYKDWVLQIWDLEWKSVVVELSKKGNKRP